jgi:hypothetical protein
MVTPVTVMALPTIIPATGMVYRGVKGKTLSRTSRNMVIAVPTRMDTQAMYLPRGTCFALWPAVNYCYLHELIIVLCQQDFI